MAQDVRVFVSSHPCMKRAFPLTSLISSSPSSSFSHSSSTSSSSCYPSTSPRLSSKIPCATSPRRWRQLTSPSPHRTQTTTFRSGTMRCAYLAQDRLDTSEAIKCLSRAMSKRRAGHMTHLKRAARFLKGVPRKTLQYTAQDPCEAHLEVHVDSDWVETQ